MKNELNAKKTTRCFRSTTSNDLLQPWSVSMGYIQSETLVCFMPTLLNLMNTLPQTLKTAKIIIQLMKITCECTKIFKKTSDSV